MWDGRYLEFLIYIRNQDRIRLFSLIINSRFLDSASNSLIAYQAFPGKLTDGFSDDPNGREMCE